MKKDEIKKILKPLIKESIREIIFEEKFLSNIISECMKSVNVPIRESSKNSTQKILEVSNNSRPFNGSKLNKNFRNHDLEDDFQNQNTEILKEFKSKTFNGVKIFDNVKVDVPDDQYYEDSGNSNSVSYEQYYGISKNDPGIDISALFGRN